MKDANDKRQRHKCKVTRAEIWSILDTIFRRFFNLIGRFKGKTDVYKILRDKCLSRYTIVKLPAL